MRIKAKLYPYPVLATSFNSDYIESNFNIEVSIQKFPTEIILSFMPILSNKGLKDLIKNNKASFVVHIESSQTSYRKILRINEEGLEYRIAADKIEGMVNICPFIIAEKDILNYSNEKFNKDYESVQFHIEKGNILAIGQEASLRVEKESDDLANVPSIFAVTENKDPESNEIIIDNTLEKINIRLPENEFYYFTIAMNNPKTISVLHSMIIIPSLMKCFEDLKNPELFMQYSDKRWARAIKKAIKKFGYSFDLDSLKSLNSFDISQKIMDNTTSRGIVDIQNIAKIGGYEE